MSKEGLEAGLDEVKTMLWACLVWADEDEREMIFRDFYKWLDMHYYKVYPYKKRGRGMTK